MSSLFVLIFLSTILAFPVGLVKPSLFQGLMNKILKMDATRKNVLVTIFAVSFVSFIGIGITADPASNSSQEDIVIDDIKVEEEDILVEDEVENIEEVDVVSQEQTIPAKSVTSEVNEVSQSHPSQTNGEGSASSSTADDFPVESMTSDPEIETESEPIVEQPSYDPGYNCSADIYNCSDFSTHAQAQAAHDYCMSQVGYDVHRLDGNDNDALACESLP